MADLAQRPFIDPHPEASRNKLPAKGLCRWCWNPITGKRRQTFCSDLCVRSFLLFRPGHDRDQFVLGRDGPLCAICHRDCVQAYELWRRIKDAARKIGGGAFEAVRQAYQEAWRPGGRFRLYEIDHRRARALGGSDHPDNLRVLCLRCHRAETAKLMVTLRAKKEASHG